MAYTLCNNCGGTLEKERVQGGWHTCSRCKKEIARVRAANNRAKAKYAVKNNLRQVVMSSERTYT